MFYAANCLSFRIDEYLSLCLFMGVYKRHVNVCKYFTNLRCNERWAFSAVCARVSGVPPQVMAYGADNLDALQFRSGEEHPLHVVPVARLDSCW